MEKLLFVLFLLCAPAFAQNECSGIGMPMSWARDSNDVVHQTGCMDSNGNLIMTNNVKHTHVVGAGPTPSAGTCTGIGSTGTCSLLAGSTDLAGTVRLSQSGAGIAATGAFTITFGSSYGPNDSICVMSLHNASGSWSARGSVVKGAGTSITSWTGIWDDNAVNLGTGLNFDIDYICHAR